MKTQQGEYASLRLSVNNGRDDALFVLDTAASVTLITPAAAGRLQARRTGVGAGPGVAGTGSTAASYQVSLGVASLAGHPLGDLTAVVMELPTGQSTDGILGLDFFNRFEAVELDWAARPGTVTLAPRGASSAVGALSAGLAECRLDRLGMGLLTVTITVGEGSGATEMPALLDSGAAFSCLNSAGASAAGVRSDPSVEPMWVAGASGQPMAMGVADRDVAFAPAAGGGAGRPAPALGGVRPLVGDLPAFAALGLAARPAALLGLDALLARPRVVLRTAAQRLVL